MDRSMTLAARTFLLLGSLATALPLPAARAQVLPGDPDHLKCYQVAKDANLSADAEIDLVNKFGLEPHCHLRTKARLFCTPVSKFIAGGNGDDPRGNGLTTDFTCYKVKCPPAPNRRLTIDDQFGHRDIGITQPKMLCAPTFSALD